MPSRSFSARTEIARAPRDVFDWVADYRNVPTVLDGVMKWEPLGEASTGVGARFEVTMSALDIPLDNVLVIDRWDEPHSIGWHSESGLIAQTGGWLFEPTPAGTKVTLTISYRPPGGALGALAAARVEGLVVGRLEAALNRLKQLLETSPQHERGRA